MDLPILIPMELVVSGLIRQHLIVCPIMSGVFPGIGVVIMARMVRMVGGAEQTIYVILS